MDSVAVRTRRLGPGLTVALASVIAGGLLSAVTARAPSRNASWAAAYLVLVVGIATLGLVLGRGFLSREQPSDRTLLGEFSAWLVGNALVLVGTLSEQTWLLDLGGLLLVTVLALTVLGVRRGPGLRWVRVGFTSLVLLLLVSIPIGLILARLTD
ncbi:MAG: hypothetical protein ABIZ07_01545 [Dermatophilaceae bacterium]